MSSRGDRGRGRGGRGGRGTPTPSDRSSPGGEGFRGRGGGPPGGDGFRGRGGPPGGDGFRGRGGPPGDRGGRGGFQDRGRGGFGGDRGGRGFGGDRGGGRGRGGGREPGGVFLPGQPAEIDARLRDNAQDALVASFRNLTVAPTGQDLPLRPGYGKNGRAIKLRANFFPVRVPKIPLQEYDVAITPASGTTNRRLKRRIWQLAEETRDWADAGMRNAVAHDHSAKLIASKKLPQPLTIAVPYYDEDEAGPQPNGKTYTLTFNYVQELDTGNLLSYLEGQPQYRGYDVMPIISALNLILAAHPNRSVGGGVMVGRNRYFFPSAAEPPVHLGGGLEAWKGFYSSVRPSFKQLMVNVNVCHTAFYTPGVLAVKMIEFERSTFGARMAVFVKGVRVKTTHLGYKKTVKSLARQTPRQYSFDSEEYGRVTCEEYFKRKYRITLQYPELPLVDVGGQKSNYLPPELCMILDNQPFRGKLTDEQTANMITAACKPPNVNGQSIVGRGLGELGFRQTAEPLGSFGVSIGTEMTVVPGRILQPPQVQYGQGRPRVDERASWNLRDVKFAKGGRLEKWAVLLIKDGNNRDEFRDVNDPDLRSTVNGFAAMCRTSGMTVDNAEPQYVQVQLPPRNQADPIRKSAIAAIRTVLRTGLRARPNLVFVILSSGDKHIYSGMKHLCDVYMDVPTVSVQSAKFRKQQPQYYANVALKVNMKMGGVNHSVTSQTSNFLKQEPTMLVGMDVTHPGPGSVAGTPSVAAVVASVENMFAQYPASLAIQESKKEMITDLTNLMVERLNAFKERNSNILPKRILVYRDGVSEGQFQTVVGDELPKIKEAFKKFGNAKAPYNPKLTIVICGKRHHTRFYPTEAGNADRDGNPLPGTVVDQGVTAVYDFDFFLQAHGGLQGTTRPTHYYVVWDEIGFQADQLQALTNEVSYMFARATKAVSLVSPAYYADLACERGRCYLHSLFQGLSESGTTTASGPSASRRLSPEQQAEETMKEAEKLWHGGVGQVLKKTMFYL
ncbi:hypothetical protein JAAARDRAFT_63333 [Jaapia argillacea MUCL 33604]|uniref:Piwi domain-containing protein n=1 Tax=Jaapia argillacea MUCL 33604 TaxID=933084 RepID=A0A067PGP6_9AGAM|nr:hypothetical protein JAAARDRAFT_63333 [Jaapia argillacea MUCL 33604]